MTAQATPPVGTPAQTGAVRGPRWGYQASFFQTRQPAFWLFMGLLVITGLLVLGRQVQYAQISPTGWFVSWILVALYGVPVFLIVRALDLFEREPISLMVAGVLWGGVVAIGFAGTTNGAMLQILAKLFGTGFAQEWGAAIVGPTVEEALKFLGVVTIFLIARSEFDDLFDGFVYGAMVGLGFDAVENVSYFLRGVAEGGDAAGLGPIFQSFFIRVIATSPFSHVLFTGVAGLGLAWYITRVDQPRDRRLLMLAGFLAAAWFAHFIANSPFLQDAILGNAPGPINWILFGFLKGLPFLIFVVLMVLLAQRRENHWFRVATASEAGTDTLPEDELASLASLKSRYAARRAAGRAKGKAAHQLVGRIQREQINLAMASSRVDRPDHPDLVRQRELVRSLRRELAAIPALPATPAASGSVPGATSTGWGATPTGAGNAAPSAWTGAAQPDGAATAAATAVQSAPPPPPPVAAAPWQPTHRVPVGGIPAWDAPDPARTPVVSLAESLDVRVVEQAGDWARVLAVNGWTGWVDARRLVSLAT